MCGSTIHASRCGWHAPGWRAGGWHAGGWHLDQVTEQDQTDDAPADALVEEPSTEQEKTPSQPWRVGTMTLSCTRLSNTGVLLSVGCTTSALSAIASPE